MAQTAEVCRKTQSLATHHERKTISMKKILKDLTIQEKALKLNLQPSIYGVFAEIGAGQEVVNQFFNAGAASGTIAKSISAYDMILSDSIYGETQKYVSRERLESMLSVEYDQLTSTLSARSPQKHFFVFANSIETTNYQKTNKGQGWMGIRFQLTPNGPPITCVIHLILHTDDVNEQRKLIGELGVNLIYGAFEYTHHTELFVENLQQNLNRDYLEVNFIELRGSQFDSEKSLRLSLQLVKSGLTRMIMLGTDLEVVQPMNYLYKKDVVLIRGRFRPPTKVTEEMFVKSQKQLIYDHGALQHNLTPVAEITFKCFQSQTELSLDDFLRRAKLVVGMGYPLVITNFTYHHELIGFMCKTFTLRSLNIVLGMDNLRKVAANGKGYTAEEGFIQLLESVSSMNGRIMAFPEINHKLELIGLEKLQMEKPIRHLFQYLLSKGKIEEIREVNKELLLIRSDKVFQAIITNNPGWKEEVPHQLVEVLNHHLSLHSNWTERE